MDSLPENVSPLQIAAAIGAVAVLAGVFWLSGTGLESDADQRQDVLDRVNDAPTDNKTDHCRSVSQNDVIHVWRSGEPVTDIPGATALLREACDIGVRTEDGVCEAITADSVATFATGDDLIKEPYTNTTYAYPFETRNDTLAATASGDVYLIPECGW